MNDGNLVSTTPTDAVAEQPVAEATLPTPEAAPSEAVTPPEAAPAPEQPAAAPQPTAPVPPAPNYYGAPVPPYGQPYGQPPYGVPPYNPYLRPQEDGGATAAMVLGILSLASLFVMGFFFGIVPMVLGIIALAMGVSSRKRVKGGKSLAGIICGSLGLAFGALIFVFWVIVFVVVFTNPELYSEFSDYGYYSEAARLLSLIK